MPQIHAACPCPYCIPCQCCILCQCFLSMSMSMYIHVEMPECRTVRHPVSLVPDWKKLTMPEQVRYRTKVTQSGIFLVRYQTKIWDAGMPMPALVSSMPMPSYGILSSSRARVVISSARGWSYSVKHLAAYCISLSSTRDHFSTGSSEFISFLIWQGRTSYHRSLSASVCTL